MSTTKTVTKTRLCRHCGKPDWCYYFENGIEVCNRGSVAPGWKPSGKTDINGNPYLYEEKAKKPKPKIVSTKHYQYTDREGKILARACRHFFDDGSDKRFRQGIKQGKWVNSCRHINREDIPIYRYIEIRQAIAHGLHIFWAEGEKCADAFWSLGIPATTNFGGSGQLQESDLLDLEGAKLVICPDRDIPGLKLAERVYEYYPHSDWLYVDPSSKFWKKELIPPSDGYDIADWITEKKLSAEDIYSAVEIYRGNLLPDNKDLFPPEAEQNYTEKAIDALYSEGHYIAIEDNLYKFTGKYYERLSPQEEQRKIANWCRSNPVSVGANRWKFAYATPGTVNNIWSWLLFRFGVDPKKINPPGINLNNGILQTNPTATSSNFKLIPHEPDYFYTYCVEIDYDPNADNFNANRLLECLDEGQRIILLRTLAASLNLGQVRKLKGREVKALLLTGTGSNGKDSLREICRILFSESMVSLSVSDFQQYDQGRKFPLAKLANCRISWSSENTKFSSLENLQSLKAAITGETIDIEQKNQPEYQIQPGTVFLFNCNEPPSLVGGSEAIQSRWGILSFNKTYKKNADPSKGELEADSRFRYDPEFLRQSVAPAFLNKILEQFPLLLQDGIDYSPTKEAFKEIQINSNHLWAFVQDTGIFEDPKGKIYIKDLWQDLREWYQATGTMEISYDSSGREKVIWHDQTNPYDKTVKAINQLHKRFLDLFPNVKKMRETGRNEYTGKYYLSGIVKTASTASTSDYARVTASTFASTVEPNVEATSFISSHVEAVEANSPLQLDDLDLCEYFVKRFSDFSPELQQMFTKQIDKVLSESSIESSSESPTNPTHVRYKGEVYIVVAINGNRLALRQAGFSKIVHRPLISECEILD